MAAGERILDLDDKRIKCDLAAEIMGLRGKYRVSIRKWFRGRTLPQNDWYHGFIVPAYQEAQLRVHGEVLTHDEAHDELRSAFLTVEKVRINQETGQITVSSRVRSTTELDTKEMSEYCELCRDMLADDPFYEIVPDPDPEKASGRRTARKARP